MGKERSEIRIVQAMFWSIAAALLNYAIALVLTPTITENVGTEAYGFVTLAKSFASYAAIFTVAINSFVSRFVTVSYYHKDVCKANAYFSTAFFSNIIIGVIIILMVCIVIPVIDKLIAIPSYLILDVQILLGFCAVNFSANTLFTTFGVSPIIRNRLDKANMYKLAGYLTEAVVLVFLFSIGHGHVYYVGIGLILASVVSGTLNYCFMRRETPEIVISHQAFSRSCVIDLVKNGIWNSINSLGNVLNHGLDLLVTGAMLSSLAMGQLSIVKTMNAMFSSVFQLVAQPLQPTQLRNYANKNTDALVKSLKLGMGLSGLLANLLFAGFAVWGRTYYQLWTPTQDSQLLQRLTFIAGIGVIIEGAVYPLYYVYTLTLKNRLPCWITIASGVVNVICMVILMKHFSVGIYAAVVTTTILSWLVNCIFNPIYSAHCLGLPARTFYCSLLRHFISAFALVCVFSVINSLFPPMSWISLISTAILAIITGSVIHATIVMPKELYALILRVFCKGQNSSVKQ